MATQTANCPTTDRSCNTQVNVGDVERKASIALGGLLVFCGLTRISLATIATALAGGALIYRGMSGHCGLYQALEVSSADE